MKIEIKNRWNGEIIFAHDAEENSIRVTVEAAIAVDINLGDANLGYANLRGADLGDANLGYADLGYANLGYANLGYANLGYANLRGADLGYANLGYANLRGADLRYANLGDANLGYANLGGANLGYANLGYANLGGADLRYANIDFSYGWRFACICSRFKIGVKFAHQVLAHLCSCDSDDAEFAEIREKILPYALKSHRAGDMRLLDDERGEKKKASCGAVEAAQ